MHLGLKTIICGYNQLYNLINLYYYLEVNDNDIL